MLRFLIAILFALNLCDLAQANNLNQVIEKFQQLHFSCVEGRSSVRCFGKISSYSMPINFYIRKNQNLASEMSLFVHFHGWWLDPKESPIEGPNGDFGEYLSDSEASAVLLVPESIGRNETYANDLGDIEKSQRFFANVVSILKKVGINEGEQWTTKISGHSGAYVYLGLLGEWIGAGRISLFKNLKGFALLDSAYGYRTGLVMAGASMCDKTNSVYVMALNPADGRSDKLEANTKIFNELSRLEACGDLRLMLVKNKIAEHVEFPKLYLPEFWRN